MAQDNFFDQFDSGAPARKDAADIEQKGASAANSAATAEETRATLPYTVAKARADAERAAAEAETARQNADKGPAPTDADTRKQGAQSRANVVRALMLQGIQRYRDNIQGQPASRGFGLFEKWFNTPSAGGIIPAYPAFETFSKGGDAILPLIRPLVAQTAKEGDSNTEMMIFQSYIPSAEDSDEAIEAKFAALDTLLAGMAEGRPPSEVVAMGLKPRSLAEVERHIRSMVATPKSSEEAEAPLAGGAVSGEGVKAPRLSAEATQRVRDYIESPDFTPEGYAALLTEESLAAGHLSPEQVAEALKRNAAEAQRFFEGMTPEDRTRTGPGLDYSRADEAAADDAGVLERAGQALRNAPESAANLVEGLAALPADAIASVVEGTRVGSIKSTTDLAAELMASAGGEPAGPTMQAFAQMLDERYGGWDAIKDTMTKDPVGFAADLSIIGTGGGTLAAKAPGALGKAGEATRAASRAADPLSGMVGAVEATPALLRNPKVAPVAETVADAPAALASNFLGLTTGAGGQSFRQAFRAGRERGAASRPTANSEAFVSQMRGGDPMEVLQQAEEALRTIRQEASDAYRSGMVDVSSDATVLSFDNIDKSLSELANRAYYKGEVRNPSAARAYEDVRSIVDEWRGLDPAEFHTPEGMDALKQKIGGLADKYNVENDRRSASIVSGVYNTVRSDIARQVPAYAKVMRDYEKAAGLTREIGSTLSLKPNAPIDSKLRKLQSLVGRTKTASSDYRQSLAELLDRNGSTLMPSAAGQSLNAALPHGLSRIPAASAALGGAAEMASGFAIPGIGPAALPALPLASPRLMGEMAYAGGRATGSAERGLGSVAAAARPTLESLYRTYQENPTLSLATARAGSGARNLEEEALWREYGFEGRPPFSEETVDDLLARYRGQ